MDNPLFLGVCAASFLHGDGVAQDFFRVGNFLPFPFFPQSLSGIKLLFAIPLTRIGQNAHVVLTDKRNPASQGSVDLSFEYCEGPDQPRIGGLSRQFSTSEHTPHERVVGKKILAHAQTAAILLAVPAPPLIVMEPTSVSVTARINDEELSLGGFDCVFAQPIPMTDAEVRAIKSRPEAAKRLAIEIACKKCEDKVRVESALEKSQCELSSGGVWLDEAPNQWRCKCGNLNVPLNYLKCGLHELFRRSPMEGDGGLTQFSPLYERSTLDAILNEYETLIDSDPSEERVQKFLEQNSILWNFLSPTWIKPKPRISTKYTADFAILSTSRILWLVEIEKPRTKLTKSDGGVHSELQTGMNQIRDWSVTVQDNRAAVLTSLDLLAEVVDDVRYMLIAGSARRTEPSHLMKLRRNQVGPADHYCFDELGSFLHATLSSLQKLK